MKRLFLGLVFAACGDDPATEVDATTEIEATVEVEVEVGPETIEETDTTEDGDVAGEVEVTPTAPWYEGAVMYEIFVRSFQDSDGDGVGDLRGIIDRLDYLNDGVPGSGDDLEVDGLWLMPIFASDSYHGYDVTDYRAIEPDYGDDADFDALIAACEARGIKVVLDYVMNHSGSNHPWFRDARSNGDKRDWYVWRGDDPGWTQPFGSERVWHASGDNFYYGVFWSGMPDLNYRTPAVRTEMTDIARSWLDRGVAGFRLDAARYLIESSDGGLFEQPETHAFWKELRAALPAEAYLVGEVWTGRAAVATYWGDGAELHQAFDFDLQGAIIKATNDASASWLGSELANQRAAGTPWDYEATFLSNHDLDRLSIALDDSEQRAAAFVLLTLPGTPYLYYGDELGAKSAPRLGDEAKRGPMAWTADGNHGFTSGNPWLGFAAQSDVRNVASASADDASLLNLYRSLIRLRKGNPALARGELVVLPPPAPRVLAFLRRLDQIVILVVVNLGATEIELTSIDVDAAVPLLGSLPWSVGGLYGVEGAQVVEVTTVPMTRPLMPHEGRMWVLERGSGDP